MACTDNTKFIIDRGLDNEFILQIKADGNLLPLVLTNTDTFSFKLFNLSTDDIVTPELELDMDVTASGSITLDDLPNGKIKITILESATADLEVERGDKADRYYLIPTYRALLKGATANGGNIIVPIDLIFVR